MQSISLDTESPARYITSRIQAMSQDSENPDTLRTRISRITHESHPFDSRYTDPEKYDASMEQYHSMEAVIRVHFDLRDSRPSHILFS